MCVKAGSLCLLAGIKLIKNSLCIHFSGKKKKGRNMCMMDYLTISFDVIMTITEGKDVVGIFEVGS